MSVDVLSVDRVSFCYNAVEVLSDVSFVLKQGDYLGIVGPNGSGKTTLIKLILGLLRPSRGTMSLFGRTVQDFREWRRVGYVPQKRDFNPHFPATVKEIVGLGLLADKGRVKRFGEADRRAVDKALDSVDMLDLKEELIGKLSGGQQQRVLIARAIVCEPEFIVFDEPSTALDPERREKFFSILKRLNEERKSTIVIITHDTGSIGKYASELLYLDKRVVFCGTFANFCTSREMSSYFGEYSQHLICHRHDSEAH